MSQPSRDITLQRILVRNGRGDGIKLSGVNDFFVDQVQILGWGGTGTGLNLIESHAGVILHSRFENTNSGRGVGVRAKAGAYDVVLRANRVVNANERSIQIGGSSSLGGFRPQLPGYVEASGIIAEGNVTLNNGDVGQGIRSAVTFVNAADGLFRNNIVYRPSTYVARILKENRQPGFIDTRGETFKDNIIVWNHGDFSEPINTGSATEPNTFTLEANQWYNSTRPQSSRPSLPSPEADGIYGRDRQIDLQGIAPWNFSWGMWLVNTSEQMDTVTVRIMGSILSQFR